MKSALYLLDTCRLASLVVNLHEECLSIDFYLSSQLSFRSFVRFLTKYNSIPL